MRAGANWVQQTLTPAAKSVVKHAIAEARRRGHAQVQPLHVAATILLSQQQQQHKEEEEEATMSSSMPSAAPPLRALEVCVNVALDHLAPSVATAGGGPAAAVPMLSNALVAALKRAHAHQRRSGCCSSSEQQPPPLLAIKVELEQLVLSVLDDPSVSRVIKEAAGTSSAAHIIKGNLEENIISSCLNPSTDPFPSSGTTSSKKPCSIPGSGSFPAPQQQQRLQKKTAKGPDSTSPGLYAYNNKLQCCAECLARFEQERRQLHELERLSLHLAPAEWCSLSSGDALKEGGLDMRSCSQVKDHSVIQKLKELRRKWQETCQNVHAEQHLYTHVSSILETEPSPLSNRLGIGSPADGSKSRNNRLRCITFPLQATIRQGNSSGLLLSKKQAQGSSTLPYWARSSPCSVVVGIANHPLHVNTAHVDGDSCAPTLPKTLALFINNNYNQGPPPQAFQESIAEGLKGLYKALLSRVGWQGEAAAAVTSAVMNSRAGMGKMRGGGVMMPKTDAWLLLLGPDPVAKRLMAKALAKMVSGSEQHLISVGFGDRAAVARSKLLEDTDDSCIRYRGRSALDRLAEAVHMKPFSILLLEDIEKADGVVRASLMRAMERGKLVDSSGREVSFGNVIVLMTSGIGAESFSVPDHSCLGGLKFSEEKLVALGGGAMRLLVEDTPSDKVVFRSLQSNAAVVVVEREPANNNADGANGELVHPVDSFLKRKSDGRPILRQPPDPRVVLQAKRPRLSFSERRRLPARALDLNLLAEEENEEEYSLLTYATHARAQKDCPGSREDESRRSDEYVIMKDRRILEPCARDVLDEDVMIKDRRILGPCARDVSDDDVMIKDRRILGCARDVLSDKFLGLLDQAVVFRAYDFCGLAKHVLAQLTKAFEGVTTQGASLEVDVMVLEHILAAIWQGSTVFDTWVADVVGKSVTAVLANVTIAENTVVKLVGDLGRGCGIRDSSSTGENHNNNNNNNTATGPQLPLFIEISQST